MPSTHRGQENEEPVDFKIDNVRQISRQLRWREVAIIDCCRVLSWRLEGKLDDPENWHAASAARLLGSLRAGDVQAIELLCKNLTLQPGVSFDGLNRLHVFVAAKALIDIGGPSVANAVIDHMKQPRREGELLLCAQVLYRNDSLEMTFERMRLAAERAKREDNIERREVFLGNVALVKQWLNNPNFAKDEQYLPR